MVGTLITYKISTLITIHLINQGSANCGPRAKCGPQSQNLRPARSFSVKNIHFKINENFIFVIKTYSKALN